MAFKKLKKWVGKSRNESEKLKDKRAAISPGSYGK